MTAQPALVPVTYGAVMRVALPAAASSSLTPLLGVVDAWVIGQSVRPLDIGAVALGATIFTTVFWSFGFLRMGTAGLAAQAIGARNEGEARAVLARAALVGAGIGAALVLLQIPLRAASFGLMSIGSGGEQLRPLRRRAPISICGSGPPPSSLQALRSRVGSPRGDGQTSSLRPLRAP